MDEVSVSKGVLRLYPKYASKIDETEYPKYHQYCFIGEAKSKEELSMFGILPVGISDNIYIGFVEGKIFYCQNGEFRKWGERANYGDSN